MKLSLPGLDNYKVNIDKRLHYYHNTEMGFLSATKSGGIKKPFGFKAKGEIKAANSFFLNKNGGGMIAYGIGENDAYGIKSYLGILADYGYDIEQYYAAYVNGSTTSSDSNAQKITFGIRNFLSAGTHSIQLSRELAIGESVSVHWKNGLEIRIKKAPIYNNGEKITPDNPKTPEITGYEMISDIVYGGAYNELGNKKTTDKNISMYFIVYYTKQDFDSHKSAETWKSTNYGDFLVKKNYNKSDSFEAIFELDVTEEKESYSADFNRNGIIYTLTKNKVDGEWKYSVATKYMTTVIYDPVKEKDITYASFVKTFNILADVKTSEMEEVKVNIQNEIYDYDFSSSNIVPNSYNFDVVRRIGDGYHEWIEVSANVPSQSQNVDMKFILDKSQPAETYKANFIYQGFTFTLTKTGDDYKVSSNDITVNSYSMIGEPVIVGSQETVNMKVNIDMGGIDVPSLFGTVPNRFDYSNAKYFKEFKD